MNLENYEVAQVAQGDGQSIVQLDAIEKANGSSFAPRMFPSHDLLSEVTGFTSVNVQANFTFPDRLGSILKSGFIIFYIIS